MEVKSLLISVAFSISFLMAGAQGRWLITNQKGISLSYDKEFFLYCKEENSDYYKITVYFANNSGKSVLIGNALVINDIKFTAGTCWNKVLPFTNPTIQFVMEVEDNKTKPWPTGSVRRDFCYIKMPKGQLPPEPRWTMSSFTFVETPKTTQPTTPQWSPWISDNCFQRIKYRYMGKELMNLNYQYHYYFQATNNYSKTIFFVLSLKDDKGNEWFGTRRSIPPGKTIEFVEKMDQDYIKKMAIEKVCFNIDDGKYLPCDDEKKATETDKKISLSGNSEWKYEDREKNREFIAISEEGLVKSHKGVPYSDLYKKTDENTYEKKWPSYRTVIKFTSNTRYTSTTFDYQGKEESIHLYLLVSSGVSEKEPKTTAQGFPASDIKGNWNYVGVNFFSDMQLNANGNGENLYASFVIPGTVNPAQSSLKSYTYTKIHQYFYTYDTDTTKSILRYLNDTTLSISYQYKNLNTLSYYTRPAAPPIVKQENKPAPVTENKTASGDCKVTGKFNVERIFNNIGVNLTVKCEGANLSMLEDKESAISGHNKQFIATAIPPIERSIVNNSKVLGTWKGIWPYETWVIRNSIETVGGDYEVIYQLLENGDFVFAPTINIANPRNNQVTYVLFKKLR